ncbi:tautomerase family protein [Rubrobacter indicoceani]|uniref:tautomerase family protein n=1 Tax=Rubrobacter indicoceani TaxID=2051957 RepID=UPI000E5AE2B8|nr:tautomerase family protein [Rubrobacter indicoceani]
MPFYSFIVPAGSPSASRRAEVARAVTEAHVRVTGAPADFVNIAFVEVGAGSIFAGGEAVEQGRMVGLIRTGRTPETKRRLLTEIARVWSEATGEPFEGFALFLHEVPGEQMLEAGRFLPEASGG